MIDESGAAARPPYRIVQADDPRRRQGAVEASEYVSGQWAHAVNASSNRAWTNAAKVIAAMAEEHPNARYVEGWATKGGVCGAVWHAWIDLPLDAAERAWMRIDATPMWRMMMKHTEYGAVLEARAADMFPFVEPLRRPRGRARCRLPFVPLVPDPTGSYRFPKPIEPIAGELGPTVADRLAAVREELDARFQSLTSMIYTDGAAELDRLAALRVLPPDRS